MWPFAPHGQCGKLLGETVAPLGKHVDDIAFVHNCVSKSGVHSQATLLQMATRPHAFEEWLAAKSVTGVDGRRGPRFEHHAMVLQAAIAGLGVAVLPAFVVEDELAKGTVVEAFADSRVRTGKGYWLVFPEHRRHAPALVAFREWLLHQHGRPNTP